MSTENKPAQSAAPRFTLKSPVRFHIPARMAPPPAPAPEVVEFDSEQDPAKKAELIGRAVQVAVNRLAAGEGLERAMTAIAGIRSSKSEASRVAVLGALASAAMERFIQPTAGTVAGEVNLHVVGAIAKMALYEHPRSSATSVARVAPIDDVLRKLVSCGELGVATRHIGGGWHHAAPQNWSGTIWGGVNDLLELAESGRNMLESDILERIARSGLLKACVRSLHSRTLTGLEDAYVHAAEGATHKAIVFGYRYLRALDAAAADMVGGMPVEGVKLKHQVAPVSAQERAALGAEYEQLVDDALRALPGLASRMYADSRGFGPALTKERFELARKGLKAADAPKGPTVMTDEQLRTIANLEWLSDAEFKDEVQNARRPRRIWDCEAGSDERFFILVEALLNAPAVNMHTGRNIEFHDKYAFGVTKLKDWPARAGNTELAWKLFERGVSFMTGRELCSSDDFVKRVLAYRLLAAQQPPALGEKMMETLFIRTLQNALAGDPGETPQTRAAKVRMTVLAGLDMLYSGQDDGHATASKTAHVSTGFLLRALDGQQLGGVFEDGVRAHGQLPADVTLVVDASSMAPGGEPAMVAYDAEGRVLRWAVRSAEYLRHDRSAREVLDDLIEQSAETPSEKEQFRQVWRALITCGFINLGTLRKRDLVAVNVGEAIRRHPERLAEISDLESFTRLARQLEVPVELPPEAQEQLRRRELAEASPVSASEDKPARAPARRARP